MLKPVIGWVAKNTAGRACTVDLGAMYGDYLLHAGTPKRIAIEIHLPYIVAGKTKGNGDKMQFIHGDMRRFDELVDKEDCDVAMMIDSLEHIDKQEGIDLLNRLKAWFNRVIVFAPCGYSPQRPDPSNPHQEHKATWEESDLRELGFRVAVYKKFHPEPFSAALTAVWDLDHA